MCRRTVVLICLLLSVSARMGAQESAPIDFETARFERRLTAKRTAGAIVIDGRLDEADWRNAPLATDFLQNDPREGEPASAATEVRVLYDDENLYFGAIAYDAEPDKLVINDLTRDFNARAGDSFGIVLDTFHDERNGYMFQTNPAGAKFDAQFINEGREFNMNWDGVWYAESRVTELGWITEIAIPFETLRFNDAAPQVWGINFLRLNRRLNENSYWAPLPRIHNFARVSLAGTLQGLSGLKRQRDIKVTPYAKGDVLQDADVATSTHFDGGLDAKLAIGSGLRLDLTLNTDFSQVEADVQQINLTRFVAVSSVVRLGGVAVQFERRSGPRRRHVFLLQPPHRPLGRRRSDPRDWRRPSDGSRGAIRCWVSQHADGRGVGLDRRFALRERRQLYRRAGSPEHLRQFGYRSDVPEPHEHEHGPLQPRLRHRRKLPYQSRDRHQRLHRENLDQRPLRRRLRGAGSLGPTTAACGSFGTRSPRSKTTSTRKWVSRRVLG